ncbi:MAG: hypothetical protein LBD29_00730 [Treponema sp.]|jgi:hypothetical protein|nr:hypothetical protein [Treponema sp.]
MKKIKRNHAPKAFALVLLGLVVSAGLFPQTPNSRILSPEIVENIRAHWGPIERAFEDLDSHEDPEIHGPFYAYNRKMESFGLLFEDFWESSPMEAGKAPDIAKGYQKILRIAVPPEVQRIYRENGLGNRGHQVIVCLFVGLHILKYKRAFDDLVQQPPKLYKKLTFLESLIHPEDMALAAQHEDLLGD